MCHVLDHDMKNNGLLNSSNPNVRWLMFFALIKMTTSFSKAQRLDSRTLSKRGSPAVLGVSVLQVFKLPVVSETDNHSLCTGEKK